MTFLHVNICSLLPKIDHVKIWASQADPDIYIVSETWLTNKTLDSDVATDGYNVFRAGRKGKGGGVAIYTNNLSVSLLKATSSPKLFELLALSLQLYKLKNNRYRNLSSTFCQEVCTKRTH